MGTKRILIIDDEEIIREVVELSLSTLGGWQVLTAASVSAGLRIAQNEQPDLILLDLFLPNNNGMTFLSMRQECPLLQPIPVVILSGHTHLLYPADFVELNIACAIAKPFDPKLLVHQIAQILNQPIAA